MADPRQQESAVAAGRADLVDISSTACRTALSPSGTRPGSTPASSSALRILFLNTRQPPFTNLKARQAVNYAIDRARIIQLLGLDSPGQATPTCQILPAGFPSYQRYCPYTAGAEDGAWHGPDMAKARRLAQESGTTNVPVTVWNVRHGGASRWAPTSSELLRQLGYRATLRKVPDDRFYAAALQPQPQDPAGPHRLGSRHSHHV